MKKLSFSIVLTLVLVTIFSVPSFSQGQQLPPEEPPYEVGYIVSINVFTNECRGKLFFNARTGMLKESELFSAGRKVLLTPESGLLLGEYRTLLGLEGPSPDPEYYYYYEGIMKYKFTPLGPTYFLNLDSSNNHSNPFPFPLL